MLLVTRRTSVLGPVLKVAVGGREVDGGVVGVPVFGRLVGGGGDGAGHAVDGRHFVVWRGGLEGTQGELMACETYGSWSDG